MCTMLQRHWNFNIPLQAGADLLTCFFIVSKQLLKFWSVIQGFTRPLPLPGIRIHALVSLFDLLAPEHILHRHEAIETLHWTRNKSAGLQRNTQSLSFQPWLITPLADSRQNQQKLQCRINRSYSGVFGWDGGVVACNVLSLIRLWIIKGGEALYGEKLPESLHIQ